MGTAICQLVLFVLVPKGKASGIPAWKQTQRKLTLRMVVHVLAEKNYYNYQKLDVLFHHPSHLKCVVNKINNNFNCNFGTLELDRAIAFLKWVWFLGIQLASAVERLETLVVFQEEIKVIQKLRKGKKYFPILIDLYLQSLEAFYGDLRDMSGKITTENKTMT